MILAVTGVSPLYLGGHHILKVKNVTETALKCNSVVIQFSEKQIKEEEHKKPCAELHIPQPIMHKYILYLYF